MVSTVWDKHSEAVPGEFAQDVRAGDRGPVSVKCCFEPTEGSVCSTGPRDDARRVLTQGWNDVVQILELFKVLHLIPGPHQRGLQSRPVKEYVGANRGTGLFLDLKAETVFVCHAWSSMVPPWNL